MEVEGEGVKVKLGSATDGVGPPHAPGPGKGVKTSGGGVEDDEITCSGVHMVGFIT